jgi:hypothetical protein
MLDFRSPSRWSCIAPRYAGSPDFCKGTRPVEVTAYSRLPESKVKELSIVHAGSEL